MADASLFDAATRFVFSPLPRDHVDHDLFSVAVEWRGNDRWAVLLRGSWCWSQSCTWDWEPMPPSRDDAWLAEHRFTRDEAIAIASSPDFLAAITVNGRTAADVTGSDSHQ